MGPWAHGPNLDSKFGAPAPILGPGPGPGAKILPLGPKISKLPLEKPCRIHYSVFQTEPYVASDGRKPFRAGWGQIPNPKSQIPSPKSQIPSPESQIPSPKSQIPSPKSQIPNPKSQVPHPKSQVTNP